MTCFCEHHQRAAKERGIDYERARQGYQKLDEFVQAALKDQRPSDGYFVEFWRLLVEWPEIIAWDRLFDATKHQVLAEVCAAVKRVRPGLQVGFHIEHVNSFNPIFRAMRSYADLATKADFLKVVVYNNCGGEDTRLQSQCRFNGVSRHTQGRTSAFQQSPVELWRRSQSRGTRHRRTLGGLRSSGDAARPGGSGREMPHPARHRHWHSHGEEFTPGVS